MKKLNAKSIAICGILTAMTVVLAEFLGINLPSIQISFNFIPIVFTAMLFGPVYCCIVSALADFIGAILFQGGFNPMFTVIAALMGLCYGLWLYRESPLNRAIHSAIEKTFKNSKNPERITVIVTSIFAVTFDMLAFTLLCTPIVLHIWYNLSYVALYPTRLIKAAIMIPLEAIVIAVLDTQVIPRVKRVISVKKA